MFRSGDLVLVSVSGGPDSICLLESLTRLRRLLRIRLAVFTFDHGLRQGSAADVTYVRRVAARLDLPVHADRARDAPAAGESVEAWARGRRRASAVRVATEIGAARIALGHTSEDQAETVLLHLLTGTGLQGLTGMAPADEQGPWIRPMLDVPREDVASFCAALGLRPRLDPTNRDTRFLRNALRLEAIPTLERALGRGVRDPVVRTAAGLREDVRALDQLAAEATGQVLVIDGGTVTLDAADLASLPSAIAKRVASAACYACGIMPSRADLEALLDLASGRPGRSADLTGGLTAHRGRSRIALTPGARSRDASPPRRLH